MVFWSYLKVDSVEMANFSEKFCDVKLDNHGGQFLRCFLCYLMKKRDGKMLRIQNREVRIEASQLVLFPSKLESTRLWVNSRYMLHVCQNVIKAV